MLTDQNENQENNQNQEISLEQVNAILSGLSQQTKAAFRAKDYKKAQEVILKVLDIAPRNTIAWMDLATTTLRMENYQLAYDYFKTCMQYMGDEIDTNAYDGMTEVCFGLKKQEEQDYYGKLAVQSKKDLVQHEPAFTIPNYLPEAFNPNAPLENIISYSLFGDSPRYSEVAILNVALAAEIYPEWTCRFYVDDTVPNSVLQRLAVQGAQIIQVSDEQKKLSGLYWRFFVMDDPTVKRFLLRDADSFVSYREKAAVDAWLNSDAWFHTMRDGYSHTELILAGMWGGCRGVFSNIQAQVQSFADTGPCLSARVMDQHYLRYCVWPTLKHSVLIHDSQGYDVQGQAFPTPVLMPESETYVGFHVGANEARSLVNVEIQHELTDVLTWILKDDQHQEVCRYDVVVNGAMSFGVALPSQYTHRIKTNEWYIVTQPKQQAVV